MGIFRIWLLAFILILLSTPVLSYVQMKENNRRFEEERQRMIQQYGSDEGLYGDCSGASIIVPILISFYALAFSLWSVILIIVAKSFSRNAVLTQTLIIGIVGVLPVILYLQLIIRSLIYYS